MKILKIYTILTLLAATFMVVIQSQQDYQTFLNALHFSSTTSDYIVQKQIQRIEKTVEAYPKYQEYLMLTEQANSLFDQTLLGQVSNDSLFRFLKTIYIDKFQEPEMITEQYSIIFQDISQNELTKAAQKSWILNEKIKLLNLLETRTRGTSIICSFGPEIVMIPHGILEKGKVAHYRFGLSEFFPNLKQMQIFVNDKRIPTRDGKGVYKKSTTQSGWNDLNIRFSAIYKGYPFQDSTQYRFFVCE